MHKLTVRLHPSLRNDDTPDKFESEFDEIQIIDAIDSLLKDHPSIYEICMEGGKNKPGLLFISGQTELTSMGLLEEILEEDLEIRIVPILHGG